MSDERQGTRDAASDEPRKTRRSRLNAGSADDFNIDQYKKPGLSYQWEAIKHFKEQIDDSDFVRIAEGGWEPVRPTEMPEIVPAGYKGQTIDRKGLRLYKRPQYLTDEARAEDLLIAQQQKEAKLRQAYSSGQDEAKRVVQQFDIKQGS